MLIVCVYRPFRANVPDIVALGSPQCALVFSGLAACVQFSAHLIVPRAAVMDIARRAAAPATCAFECYSQGSCWLATCPVRGVRGGDRPPGHRANPLTRQRAAWRKAIARLAASWRPSLGRGVRRRRATCRAPRAPYFDASNAYKPRARARRASRQIAAGRPAHAVSVGCVAVIALA
eukprot:6212396-Pleurochrysis_carterae.AAC.2